MMRQALRALVLPLALLTGLHLWQGPQVALRIGMVRAQSLQEYAKDTLPERVEKYALYLGTHTHKLPSLSDCDTYPELTPTGYDPDTNTICFDPTFNGGFHFRRESLIDRGFIAYLHTLPGVRFLENGDKLIPGRINVLDTDSMLDHEVGHYLTDVIATNESIDFWDDPYLAPGHTLFGQKLISEGIATALARDECGGFEDSEYPPQLPSIISDTFWEIIYFGGCNIVAPIIEKHRAAGIAYLLRHPPEVDSPADLPVYRESVLAELEKNL